MAIPRNDSEFLRKARELGIPLDPEGLGKYAQEYGLGSGQPVSYAPGARFQLLRELVLRRMESEGVDVGSSIETRAEAEQTVLARNIGATRRSRASYYRQFNASLAQGLVNDPESFTDETIVQAGERSQRFRDAERSRQEISQEIIAQEKEAINQGFVRRDVFYSQDGGLNFMYFQAGQNDLFSKMPKQYASGLYSEAPENRVSDPYYFPSPYKPFDIDLTDLESSETITTTRTGRDLSTLEDIRGGFSDFTYAYQEKAGNNLQVNFYGGFARGAVNFGAGILTQGKEIQDALFSKQKSSMIASLSLKYVVGGIEFTTKEIPRQLTSPKDFGEGVFNVLLFADAPKSGFKAVKTAGKGFFQFGKFVETGVTRGIPEALDRADVFGGKPVYDPQRIRPTVKLKFQPLVGQKPLGPTPDIGIIPEKPSRVGELENLMAKSAYEKFYKNQDTRKGLSRIEEPYPFDFGKISDFALNEGMLKREPVNTKRIFSASDIFEKNKVKPEPRKIGFPKEGAVDIGFGPIDESKLNKNAPNELRPPEDLAFNYGANEIVTIEMAKDLSLVYEGKKVGKSTSGLEFYELDYLNQRPIGKTKNILVRNAKSLLFGTTILAGAGVLSAIDPVNAKYYATAGIIGSSGSITEDAFFKDAETYKPKRKGPRIRIRDDFDSPEAYFPSRTGGRGEVYDQYRDLVESERKGRIAPSPSLMGDVLRYSPRVIFKTERRAKSEPSFNYLALSRFKTDKFNQSKKSTENLKANKNAFNNALRYDLIEKTKTKTVKLIRSFSPNYGSGDYGDFDLIEPPKRIEEPPPNNSRTNDDYFFNRPTGRSRKSFTVSRGFRYSPDITSYIAGFKTSKKRGAFSIGEVRPFYQPKKSKRSRK